MQNQPHFGGWQAPAYLCIPVVVTYVLLVPVVSWIRGSGSGEYLPAVVAAVGCLSGTVTAWLIIRRATGTDAKVWAMVLGFLPRTMAPLMVVGLYAIFVERLVGITAFVYCIVFYVVALAGESWLTLSSLRREGFDVGQPRDS